jgi:hypothetical protein
MPTTSDAMATSKTILYYYLDDGDQAESTAFAKQVESVSSGLKILHRYPAEFSSQIKDLLDASFEANGLILDLRLDQTAHEVNSEKQRADYRAPALAQEIRTRAGETRTGEYPIVLWSFDRRLQESYRRDHTSHDLFDLIVVKDHLKDKPTAREVWRKLVALANGYPRIAEIRNSHVQKVGWFHLILGFEQETEASFLDPRILEHFDNSQLARPVHEFARFLIHQMLDIPGPLIDHLILAARLGLDLEASKDAEALFNKHFSQARYHGVFGHGWERWWAFFVEEAWRTLDPNAKPLRRLSAVERVNHLKATTGIKDLKPAEPLHPGYSTSYWTICQKLRKPLDPRNGFLLNREKAFRWQEEQFVSFEAYKQRLVVSRDIDPVDRGRLERMKEERPS